MLADQLYALISNSDNTGPTDAQILHTLAETQRIRFPRAMKFLKASHDNQSMQVQTHVSQGSRRDTSYRSRDQRKCSRGSARVRVELQASMRCRCLSGLILSRGTLSENRATLLENV